MLTSTRRMALVPDQARPLMLTLLFRGETALRGRAPKQS